MRPQLHVPSGPPAGFIPSLTEIPQAAEPLDEMLRLAPAVPVKERPRALWERVDWTAVGAAGLVYAVAFAAWVYLAK